MQYCYTPVAIIHTGREDGRGWTVSMSLSGLSCEVSTGSNDLTDCNSWDEGGGMAGVNHDSGDLQTMLAVHPLT